MKKIFFVWLLTTFIACNKQLPTSECPVSGTEAQASSTSTTSEVCSVTNEGPINGTTTGATNGGNPGSTTGSSTTGTLPTSAFTFGTNIDFLNASAAQEDKLERAVEVIKKVIATEDFRTRILNHTYNGAKTFVDNGGHTNAQIYQMILDGAETLLPVKNNMMDLQVELYYALTSTVGYTYANTTKIWVNTKFFNSYAVNSVAANLIHEWLHKLGFTHAASYSVSRDYSVPYGVGRIMSELGKQFL
jgi:hypothetical protein